MIARVLAADRGKGYGEQLYAHGLREARELGANSIETVVLVSNGDGRRFVLRHGFIETGRVPWIDLRLS